MIAAFGRLDHGGTFGDKNARGNVVGVLDIDLDIVHILGQRIADTDPVIAQPILVGAKGVGHDHEVMQFG